MIRSTARARLLMSTALTGILASAAPMAAHAATTTTVNAGNSPYVTPVTATATGDTLNVTTGGNMIITGSSAFTGAGNTGLVVNVNTGNPTLGITDLTNVAIDLTNPADALAASNGLHVTSGLLTGFSTASTVNITGAANSYSIANDAAGTISNQGAGGEVFVFGGTNGNQTVTLTNAGTIQGTNNAGTIGIRLFDTTGGSSLDVENTGSILTGALATAVGVETGGAGVNHLLLNNSGAGSVITGNVVSAVGANDTSTVNNQGHITGDVTATAGALTFGNTGTLTGNATNGTGTSTIGNSGTISGNVTTGAGHLTYTGNTAGTVGGNVTATTGDLDVTLNNSSAVTGNVTLGNNAGSTAVLNGTSSVGGNVTLNNAGQTATLNGGSVTGLIQGTGNLAVTANSTLVNDVNLIGNATVASGSTLNLGATGNDVTATTTTIANNAGLTFNNGTTHTFNGNLTGAGGATGALFTLGNRNQAVNGTFTTNTNDTLSLTLNPGSPTQSGKILTTTSATSAGTKLNVNYPGSNGYITNGQQFVVVDGTAGTASALTNDAAQINVNNTGTNHTRVLTFNSASTDAGRDLSLVVARASYASVATTQNAANVGNAINAIGTGATGNLALLQQYLDTATTTAQVQNALESATPEADNAETQGIYTTTSKSFDVVSERLSRLRSGTTGLSTGNDYSKQNVWMNGFGSNQNQGNRDGVAGYDNDVYGLAAGADKEIGDHNRLGFSLNYANSNIDSHSGTKSLDVDTYQANLYGSHDFNNGFYSEGMLGFAWNSYDSTRTIPAVAARANGDFDGQTYLARVAGGYRYLTHGFDVTPHAALTYAHLNTDSYNESGAGTLNLNVHNQSDDILEPRIGIDTGYMMKADSWTIRPVIRASYGYEIMGDNQSTTSQFTGTAPTFTTNGPDVAKSSYTVGAGVDLVSVENVALSANYDYEHRSDYNASTGMLKLNYAF